MDPLRVGSSQRSEEWYKALLGQDDALLARLADEEPPGATLFMLATYVNGLYHGRVVVNILDEILRDSSREQIGESPFGNLRESGVQSRAFVPDLQRVEPVIRAVRRRLAWRQREADIGVMREIRRSSMLSVVLGAGATMAARARGPSWSEIVRFLLERALSKGHETIEMVLVGGSSSAEPIAELTPDGMLLRDGKGTWNARVVNVTHFGPPAEHEARRILALIDEYKDKADIEVLKNGAQLCYDLFGQDMFTHITGLLYSSARGPSEIHHAVAELADAQWVSGGTRYVAGWDAIITYNFDTLMSEALAERSIPHVGYAMRAGEIAADPDPVAHQSAWHQPILHLHGYTPRRPFLITHTDFVFSTSQYIDIYGRTERTGRGIIHAAFESHLAKPMHIALYIGCGFGDEHMNDLLRRAAGRYPGRTHFALLMWPGTRPGSESDPQEIEKHSERFLEMGVQPVWIEDFGEIPGIIKQLK